MKKVVSLVIAAMVVVSFPVLFASDGQLILRAIHDPEKTSFQTTLLPGWLADIKLRKVGINKCTLSFPGSADVTPVVNFLVSAYGGDGVNEERIKDYIGLFSRQGCSVNGYDRIGMTALHSAVLFAQPELVTVLLENNASLLSRIKRPGSQVNGMQPLKFARYLSKTNAAPALQQVISLLKQASKPQ